MEETMVRPSRVDSMDDIKTWIADHDGRIDAWWEAQHALNDELEERITKNEKRLIWLMASAAAGGGVAGQIIATLFGG